MENLKYFSLVGLVLYFAVLLFVVLRDAKHNTVLDYFFAGRKLSFWALSITFIASWWGAGSAISTADLAYADGMGAFWYYGVPVLLSTLLMVVLSKSIRQVGYLTQGKMMQARYSKSVGIMLSLMILLFMTITAASQMVGIGDFFGAYLGIGYELAVVSGTGIVLIYSFFGGFRGVVLTDIIQFILLLISALIVFGTAMHFAGGVEGIAQQAEKMGKQDYMSITKGSGKYLAYVITFGCAWMIQANVWQRISATKNVTDARKMTGISFFIYIPLYLMVVFTGMAGLVLYPELPKGGVVSAIIMDYMHPLLGGVVFIGICAAIMSTMDSLINTGAMTLSLDLRKPNTEKNMVNFSRYATLGVTLVAVFIALKVRSILSVSWIASDIITTGVFVPLVMGFLWRRGNSKGALVSMVVGGLYCLYNLSIILGAALPRWWEAESVTQVLAGVFLSGTSYLVVSFCTAPEYERADNFMAKAGFGKIGRS